MTLSLPNPDSPREGSQDHDGSPSAAADAPHVDRDDAPSSEAPRAKQRSRQSAKSTNLPTEEEIAAMLTKLTGAVSMRLMTPGQAGAIHRNLRTLLDMRRNRQTARSSNASTEDLAALLRADPALMNVMAPFLSDEQVDWLLRQGEEASE